MPAVEGGNPLDIFISELVLSAADQRRRNERRRKQAEGIAAAKARGVQFGRPKVGFPPHFAAVVRELDNKTITTATAQRLCGMTRSTFSRRLQRYRQECGINK